MAKILYIINNNENTDIDAITKRLGEFAQAEDINIQKVGAIEDIKKIADISDYSFVVISDQSSIPPWKLIDEVRNLTKDKNTVFWVDGDLNSITSQYLQTEGLTGSVLVTRDSREMIAACNGNVDGKIGSEANIITMETQHNICSIGKMLTGLTVLKLVQDGMLSLDDPIGRYLPDNFPDKDKFRWTTIRQLVTHTAGMGNYTGKYNIVLNSSQEAPHFKKLEDFSEYIEHPTDVKPNEFRYSNVGFIVLGEIIEQVINKNIPKASDRKDYWDAISEHILKPNGITITRDIPVSSLPCATNVEFKKTIDIASSPAGANMWATPEALAKFGDWFVQQLSINPEIEQQIKSVEVDTHYGTKYAFGVMHPTHEQDFYCHNGGAPGISSNLHIFPSSKTSEVVFVNNDNTDGDLATRVAIQIATKVIMPDRIYYADPKFSNNTDKLFQSAAQEAGLVSARRELKF